MIDLKAFPDLVAVKVGDFKPKPTTLTKGQTEATAPLWSSEDGKTNIGIWECTPGHFTADRSQMGEYCHILAGSATVSNHDGSESRDISAGDLLVLPQGWKGQWVIHIHMRKLYILSATSGLIPTFGTHDFEQQ